jgi:hypothetical protein
MPRYIVTVFERAVVECEYEIEADDPEEAKKLALDGIYESREVQHPGRAEIEPEREVYGEPKEQDGD